MSKGRYAYFAIACWIAALLIGSGSVRAQTGSNEGVRIDRAGRLDWVSPHVYSSVSVEFRTNLINGVWLPMTNSIATNSQGQARIAINTKNRQAYYRTIASDLTLVPSGMGLVPSGYFVMGDANPLVYTNERPVHVVYVSAFYADRFEITNEQAREMLQWAADHSLITVDDAKVVWLASGQGEVKPLFQCKGKYDAVAHNQVNYTNGMFTVDDGKEYNPVVGASWHGAVTYCNWRSQREGFSACYDLTNWACNFNASGYRLPTEVEWEKAARGGLTTNNFPWSSPGTAFGSQIGTNMATYTPVGLPHPFRNTPVGYYNGAQDPPGPDMANGYGLYDMAGNVREWCWDWYQSGWYADPASSLPDTTGPTEGEIIQFPNKTAGPTRVTRGGSFDEPPKNVRCAFRGEPYQSSPVYMHWYHGFRCVRRP